MECNVCLFMRFAGNVHKIIIRCCSAIPLGLEYEAVIKFTIIHLPELVGGEWLP